MTGTLSANRLDMAGIGFDALSLALTGTLDAVTWRLAWAGGDGQGVLRRSADGIRLDVAAFGLDAAGQRFVVEAPFTVTRLTSGALTVGAACIAGGSARACLRVSRWTAAESRRRGPRAAAVRLAT